MDTFSFIKNIHSYNPCLIKTLCDYIFVRCYRDDKQKYKYILATSKNANKTISELTYSENNVIKKVIIDNNIETIDNFAFYTCSNLNQIIIPKSVKTIGSFTFAWCLNLTHLTIPDSVENIDPYSFTGCKMLKQISIPKHLASTINNNSNSIPKHTKIIVR